jgi:outer membrane protein OmpA-like peptidoglycan-associated protein
MSGCGGETPRPEVTPGALGLTMACGGHVAADGQIDLPGHVEFDFFKTVLRDTPATEARLTCVVDFLTHNPRVTKLDVSVFMDDTGDPAVSTRMSEGRARAVVRWLEAHGIAPERLEGRGFGPTHPLVPNDSPEHKAINRRADFSIAELDHLPAFGHPSSPAAPSVLAVEAVKTTPAIPQAATLGAPLVAASPQPTAYALVIGVEKYGSGLPPPTGARADAQLMSDVFHTSLGISSEHIQLLVDEHATKGAIEGALAWANAMTPEGGRIYFYFSGHGSPDTTSGSSYLVPTDGDPRYLEATGLSMREVLAKLGQTKAREVVAMVDACFSGAGGRSVLPPGARPLLRVRADAAPSRVALFSASAANEISGPVPGGAGGLFTSYLVQALGHGAADINGDGQVSLAELGEWVSPRVTREAQKDNRTQTPSLVVGQGLGAPGNVMLAWGLPAH